MAEFQYNQRTYKGLALLSKQTIGNAANPLKITSVKAGSGQPPDGADLAGLESLVHYAMDVTILSFENAGKGIGSVTVEINNKGLTSGFDLWEFGVYALDPDTNKEILYSYIYAKKPI